MLWDVGVIVSRHFLERERLHALQLVTEIRMYYERSRRLSEQNRLLNEH
jgi:hypothetical protein